MRQLRRAAVVLSFIGLLAAGWWLLRPDDSTERDREPVPLAPTPDKASLPVLLSSGPLPGANTSLLAKPVVAADGDRRVVVTAMKAASGAMHLARWRSADGGQTWPEQDAFDDWPAGCDYLGDPWLATDHRDRFHLVHLATSMEARNTCPCVYRRSADGGRTWPLVRRVAEGVDRPVLAVSPGGQRLAIVCMMHDPSADPLTLAELQDPAAVTSASNRVRTQGVFRSGDRGRSWSRLPGPRGLRHAVPFAAVIDDDGRVAAAWVSNDGKGSKSVVGSTSDGGKTWSEVALVEALQPDRDHPFNGGRFPVVALDESGRLQAVYGAAGGTTLWASTSQDWTTWSAPLRLSTEGAEEVRNAAIATAGDVVHAAWMERSGKRYQMRYRASRDGGASWSAPLVLSRPHAASPLVTGRGFHIVGDDDQPAVADDRAGKAHVVWALGSKAEGGHAVWHATVGWGPRKR